MVVYSPTHSKEGYRTVRPHLGSANCHKASGVSIIFRDLDLTTPHIPPKQGVHSYIGFAKCYKVSGFYRQTANIVPNFVVDTDLF